MDSSVDQSKSQRIEEKNEKLKIILDNADNTYHSGQTIQGTIYLNYTEIRGVYFRVIGKSKCCWTELFVRESKPVDGKKETTDSRYWGKEEHLNPAVYITGSKGGALFAPEKSYQFSFDLKSDLPSSFHDDYGTVKYKMKFIVDKRWFNDKQTISLNIIRSVNLNTVQGTLQPFEHQLTKTYGFVDSGPISLHVSVAKRGFVLGEKIPITATITNSSKINVEKLKYYLNQIIEYHSLTPSERIKSEYKRLLKKETDGVCKKSEQKLNLVIDVPDNIPPNQDGTASRLIHIKYELKVEAKIGGIHKSLVITVPITIGTVPHLTSEQSVILRVRPDQLNLSDAHLSGVFSNMSIDMNSPQNQSIRSSAQSSIYPITQIGFVSNPSIGSQSSYPLPQIQYHPSNRFSVLSPSAPPLDFDANSPVRPTSFVPPSYEEACFGVPNQINFANSSPIQNTPSKF